MGPSRPNQSRIKSLRQHHFEAVGFVVRREDLDDCHLGRERRGEDHVLVAADHVVFRHRAGEIENPNPLDWQGRRVHHMNLVAGSGQEQAAFLVALIAHAFGGEVGRALRTPAAVSPFRAGGHHRPCVGRLRFQPGQF